MNFSLQEFSFFRRASKNSKFVAKWVEEMEKSNIVLQLKSSKGHQRLIQTQSRVVRRHVRNNCG